MTALPRLAPIFRVALWMVGTFTSLLSMAVAGRELAAEITIFQLLFWRGAVGLAVLLLLFQITGGWRHLRTRKFAAHGARSVVHLGAQYAWFYAIALIPLAEVFALEFTTPIWTLILAALILGERITAVRVAAVILGFAGVLIILRPGSPVGLPQMAALASALGFAFATYVMTRQLMRTDTPQTMLFWMVLIQTPLALAAGLDSWTWPAGANWGWIAVVGIGSLAAHYCMARALSLADANVVVPMDFARLPLAMIVGWLAYEELIDLWVVVGAAIIFAGNYLNVRAESRKSPRPQ